MNSTSEKALKGHPPSPSQPLSRLVSWLFYCIDAATLLAWAPPFPSAATWKAQKNRTFCFCISGHINTCFSGDHSLQSVKCLFVLVYKAKTRMRAKLRWFSAVKKRNGAGGNMIPESMRVSDGRTCSAIMWEDVMRSHLIQSGVSIWNENESAVRNCLHMLRNRTQPCVCRLVCLCKGRIIMSVSHVWRSCLED